MFDKLKGFKVYLIAALVAVVSLLTGGTPEAAAAAAGHQAPEAGLLLAAGIAFGRAAVSFFAAMRERGLIQANPLATLIACAMVASMLPLAGCASLSAGIEQVQPRTARETLAVAEVTFVGVVTVAADLHRSGILSSEDARDVVLPRLEQVNDALALGRSMLAAGDEANAGRVLNAAILALNVLSVELARRRDEAGRDHA